MNVGFHLFQIEGKQTLYYFLPLVPVIKNQFQAGYFGGTKIMILPLFQ